MDTITKITIVVAVATPLLAFGGAMFGHWLSSRTSKEATRATLDQRESERRQSLAMAALSERLAKHQEAFALWYKMSRKVSANANQDELMKIIAEVREWWIHNCLYLDSRARYALWDCMHDAGMYENTLNVFKEAQRAGKPAIEEEQDMKQDWAFIKRGCGQIIEACVDIPGFAQRDNFPDANPNGEASTDA